VKIYIKVLTTKKTADILASARGQILQRAYFKVKQTNAWYIMLINPWGQNMGAEQETLGISFRANPRKIKNLGIPFGTTS
jgi:hypothetical protein